MEVLCAYAATTLVEAKMRRVSCVFLASLFLALALPSKGHADFQKELGAVQTDNHIIGAKSLKTHAIPGSYASGKKLAYIVTRPPKIDWKSFAAFQNVGFEQSLSRNQIKRIQEALATLGYKPGMPDGLIGKRTKQAIRRYQEKTGAVVSGEPTLALLTRLEKDAELGTKAAPSPSQPLPSSSDAKKEVVQCSSAVTINLWTKCEGTYTGPAGTEYVGEWKDGMYHGKGTLTLSDGRTYVGGWKDSKLHGQGTITYPSGITKSSLFVAGASFGFSTYTSPDGIKYVGEWKDGRYHGYGTWTHPNGREYVGEWKDGKTHGFGTEAYANGGKYAGEWEDGKIDGHGVLTYPDGTKYVGEWKDGKRHGHGAETRTDGHIFVGEWRENKFTGIGAHTRPNWDKFIGEFKDYTPQGKGIYVTADEKIHEVIFENGSFSRSQGVVLGPKPGSPFAECRTIFGNGTWTGCKGMSVSYSGAAYFGEWKDGEFHGQGTFTYADGTKYVGEWKDGKFYGQGTWTLPSGRKMVGEWKNGKLDGLGTHNDPNGFSYVGEWKDGGHHGQGTMTFKGRKYVGEWKDGLRHGHGTMGYPNGGKYIGEWKEGEWHGRGTETRPGISEYVGEFKKGEHHGHGTETSSNGFKYVGEWEEGKRHGHGTETFPNGGSYVGEWKEGKRHGQGTETFPNLAKYVGEWQEGQQHGQGIMTLANGIVYEGIWGNGEFLSAQEVNLPEYTTPPAETEITQSEPVVQPPQSVQPTSSGSGFFISKVGHVVTNAHVVNDCGRVTVGDSGKSQIPVEIVDTDGRNDLALLKLSANSSSSSGSTTLLKKLGVKIVPLAASGLLRSKDIELGERVLVAGYPYGEIFSDTIKVTGGMVSANRGMGDDIGQFQIDAAVQPGNSGGPIYDENGNIVGVVVAQLDRLKVAKAIGSLPENVNFGIKASTVRQFLTASGLPTKWSARSQNMSTRELAKIAKNQTVMVVCHR